MTMMTCCSESQAAYRLGSYLFDPDRQIVTDERGAEIPLTRQETRFLDYLRRAGGRSVDRSQILRDVWGYCAAVKTHTLETHVYRIRKKIEPDSSRYRILIWEDGGYRLAL